MRLLEIVQFLRSALDLLSDTVLLLHFLQVEQNLDFGFRHSDNIAKYLEFSFFRSKQDFIWFIKVTCGLVTKLKLLLVSYCVEDHY